MKIHKIVDQTGAVHLVKSHTKGGARKHVAAKLRDSLHVKVPTQDELVAALQAGIEVEDATVKPAKADPENPGGTPISQTDEE